MGTRRRRPCVNCRRSGATDTFDSGSPNSSVMRPVITAPRGRRTSIPSAVWLLARTSGLLGPDGCVWPYDQFTNEGLDTLIEYRPAGRSLNSYRPLTSV